METLNIIVNNDTYYLPISKWINKIISIDIPTYITYNYNENEHLIEFSYMFDKENKETREIGKTKMEIGKDSGRIYLFQSAVDKTQTGFVHPAKFKETLLQIKELAPRAKENVSFGLHILESILADI